MWGTSRTARLARSRGVSLIRGRGTAVALVAALLIAAGSAAPSGVRALVTAPANDFFAFATTVTALPFTDAGVNTTLATTETNEPGPTCGDWDGYKNIIWNSVWYKYVAAASTTLSATMAPRNLVGNNIAGVVTAYEGTGFDSFSEVRCAAASKANAEVNLAFPVTAGRTYYIQVGGRKYGWSGGPSGVFDFSVGAPGPTATAPVASLPSGATLGTSGVPVKTTWTGTGHGSAIDHYVVQRRTDGGAWTTVATTSATSATWALGSGHAYQFRVQAIDANGATSAWATGGLFQPVAYQESASAIAYRGTWASELATSAYGGRLRYAKVSGATATFTFTGRSVAWVSTRAPSRGYAKVYVNGVYTTRINLASSSTTYRRVVWTKNWSTPATRTVRIVAEGTAGHPRVDVDAFLILR